MSQVTSQNSQNSQNDMKCSRCGYRFQNITSLERHYAKNLCVEDNTKYQKLVYQVPHYCYDDIKKIEDQLRMMIYINVIVTKGTSTAVDELKSIITLMNEDDFVPNRDRIVLPAEVTNRTTISHIREFKTTPFKEVIAQFDTPIKDEFDLIDSSDPIHRKDIFLETYFKGLYVLFTELLTMKLSLYEKIFYKKTYDDMMHITCYRKNIYFAYLSLRKRLDCEHQYMSSEKYRDLAVELKKMEVSYLKEFVDEACYPDLVSFDPMFFQKIVSCKLTTLETYSIVNFYDRWVRFIRNLNNQSEPSNFDDPIYSVFPDYQFEIVERDFFSHLVKIYPKTIPRKTKFWNEDTEEPFEFYYKRIYIDGTSRIPLTPEDYEKYKDIY